MLPWYGYALLSAVFSAAMFITRKKGLTKEHSLAFDSTRMLIQAGLMLLFIPFLSFEIPLHLIVIVTMRFMLMLVIMIY